ncbi:MAG: hypothetical protein ABIP33_08270 [Pseudolysinimonas sp.]
MVDDTTPEQLPDPTGTSPVPPPPSVPPIGDGGSPDAAQPVQPVPPVLAAQPVQPVPPVQAAQPVQPTPDAAQPMVAAPGFVPPATPRRGLPLGAILGIAGGGVALLVVIVIIAALIVPRILGGGSPSSSPDGVLTAYLKAVAASDSKTAISYIDDANQPSHTGLLTDSALRASNKLGAIKSIKVAKPTKNSGFVDLIARYTIGGTPVTAKYTVDDLSGTWQVERGTTDLDLSYQFKGIDLTLNGTAITGGKATVFPGTYVLGTTSKDFTITGTTKLVVKDEYESGQLEDSKLALTDTGLAAFRQAVTAAVTPCLASKALAAGCGLDLPATLSDGTQLEDGTVTRTLDGDGQSTLAGLKPSDFLTDVRKISSEYIGSVDTKATCTKDGRRGICSVFFGPGLGEATVDFTTDPPTVRWN